MAREECRVSERGIWHLFAPFAVGAVCVCGRKVAVVEDDTLMIHDAPSAALLSAMETLQRRFRQAARRG
jgi:hypothetical protein